MKDDIRNKLPVRTYISGGDVLKPEYIDHLSKAGNVYNSYGPTESTVCITFYQYDPPQSSAMSSTVPIGKPLANYRVYILDKYNNPVPVGVPGELHAAGDGVTRGYLNRPELTAEKFVKIAHSSWLIADRKNKDKDSMQKADSQSFPMSHELSAMSFLYKTGDLAGWIKDGNIEFLGRINQQVKIRGYRIELGEIENHLLRHGNIEKAVVLARSDDSGDKYLSAYVVYSESGSSGVSDIREYLLTYLPDYMVPPYVVPLDTIPFTASGKVNRSALPAPEFKAGSDYIAPRSAVENQLAEFWSEVLGIDRSIISIDSNFFELGGHSLKATTLVSNIHKEMDMKIPLGEIFRTPTVRGLAQYIKKHSKKQSNQDDNDIFIPIEAAEKKEHHPLSSAQKRLFILQQMDLENTAYNMPHMLLLAGVLNKDRLEKSFRELVKRHETLRTSFHLLNGQPIQKIHDRMEFTITNHELNDESSKGTEADEKRKEKIVRDFVKPFDLSVPPLLRVGLIKVEKQEYILMMDMHHIISDGTSTAILVQEFMALYGGKKLSPMRIRYIDYSQWQQSNRQQEVIKRQEDFWLGEFEGDIIPLNLPTDYPRPEIQSFEGEVISFEVSEEMTAGLGRLALETGATVFMVISAVFNILLAKVTGAEDIIIGTGIEGRRNQDIRSVVGMFVNALALRNFPSPSETFNEFLEDLKENTLLAFENQDYQFEDIVGQTRTSEGYKPTAPL